MIAGGPAGRTTPGAEQGDDSDQAWDEHSDTADQPATHTLTLHTTTPPPPATPPTQQQQPTSTPPDSSTIFTLIHDPAAILTRLQAEQDQQQQPSPPSPKRARPSLPWEATPSQPGPPSEARRREQKFLACLAAPTVDVAGLRKLAWAGIPPRLRALVWMILLGYLPPPRSRRLETLARKRREYLDALRLAFAAGTHNLDQTIWHQIQIDVARTHPGVPLWQFHATQRTREEN
ncbi:hypothetical protein PtA15_1A213 [Puccinia triticina]|uniref:Rab-GAP TBC domain-containing protein n=1 Tax=Puccinia triticina TaxID=208348 RepID=A0ABY7C6V5_9BASI|nr:uncharacterized protein PtA15_1A213 [Puccinia triticina]WAQ80875.1 hypothetical protein PtA15_1A213 [Puccinia triticina]